MTRHGRSIASRRIGGTSLGSGDRINRAADSIAAAVQQGHEVAVVASAIGTRPTNCSKTSTTTPTPRTVRTSFRWTNGISGCSRVPRRAVSRRSSLLRSEDWPIIADEYGEVDVDETQSAPMRSPASSGCRPGHHGFVAQDYQGNVTTLVRGGSDTRP